VLSPPKPVVPFVSVARLPKSIGWNVSIEVLLMKVNRFSNCHDHRGKVETASITTKLSTDYEDGTDSNADVLGNYRDAGVKTERDKTV
jgi:hypothetical protein